MTKTLNQMDACKNLHLVKKYEPPRVLWICDDSVVGKITVYAGLIGFVEIVFVVERGKSPESEMYFGAQGVNTWIDLVSKSSKAKWPNVEDYAGLHCGVLGCFSHGLMNDFLIEASHFGMFYCLKDIDVFVDCCKKQSGLEIRHLLEFKVEVERAIQLVSSARRPGSALQAMLKTSVDSSCVNCNHSVITDKQSTSQEKVNSMTESLTTAQQTTSKWVDMTPDLARQILKLNEGNRRLRNWWVEDLAAAIKLGEWMETHQGIAITSSGRLLDGQHRLEAVVRANIAVRMLVTKGIPDESFKVIDAGVKRSVSDLTGLDKGCAAVSRLATSIAFPRAGSSSAQRIFAVASCGISEVYQDLITACPTIISYFSSAPMRLAAIILVMNGHSREYVFDVYANLVRQNYDDLPVIAKSLNRQVMARNVSAGKTLDAFARGLKVLSPECATLSLLKITDKEIKASTEMARETIKGAMAASEKVLI